MQARDDPPSSPFGATSEYHRDHQSASLPVPGPALRQAGSGSSFGLPASTTPHGEPHVPQSIRRPVLPLRPCTVVAFKPVVARRSASTDLNALAPLTCIAGAVAGFEEDAAHVTAEAARHASSCYGPPRSKHDGFPTGVDGPSAEADRPRRTAVTSPAEAFDGPLSPQLQQSHRQQSGQHTVATRAQHFASRRSRRAYEPR